MQFANQELNNKSAIKHTIEMKANELRIGNWFLLRNEEREVTAMEIAVLNFESDDIKPIPLTEEWLERFGYNSSVVVYGRFYKDTSVGFLYQDIVKAETRFGTNEEYVVRHCKHVHQLQNLYFALTGEELKIKL